MASDPKVKAFLLCDQVIQGVDGKHSIIGAFQRVHAPQFPVFHARFGIYMRLGEMNGAYELAIRFVDPNDEKTLAEALLKGVRHDRPLDDFETGVNLPGIEIAHDGTFEVRVFANNRLIHVDTLRAIKVDMPSPPPGGGPKGPTLPGFGPSNDPFA